MFKIKIPKRNREGAGPDTEGELPAMSDKQREMGQVFRSRIERMVDIEGLKSNRDWHGRGSGNMYASSKFGGFTTTSLQTMKHYAGLETSLPPVGTINLYVQPDGRAFADNGAGDSHRIGAAYLRGDARIRCKQLVVTLLDDSVL